MHRMVGIVLLGALFVAAPAAAQLFPAPSLPAYPLDPRSLVDGWYARFLKRPADPGADTWVEQLRSGNPPAITLAIILGGWEYYGRAGNRPEGFVRNLFLDLTNQEPTIQELNSWVARVAAEDRTDVAYALVKRYPQVLTSLPQTLPTVPSPLLGCHFRYEPGGLRVCNLQPSALASRIGLRTNDLIQAVDGRNVRTIEQLRAAIFAGPEGLPHSVMVLRYDQTLRANVRIVNQQVLVDEIVPSSVPCNFLGCALRPDPVGLRVESILVASVATQLGLSVGDYIWAVDGRPCRSVEQLQNLLYQPQPTPLRQLTIVRGNRQFTAAVQVAGQALGVGQTVQTVPVAACPQFGCHLRCEPFGMVVQSVNPNSPAAELGCLPGDVFLAVGSFPVRTLDQLSAAVIAGSFKSRIRVDVRRGHLSLRGYVNAAGGRISVRSRLRPDGD